MRTYNSVLLAVKDSISTEPFIFNCESMELSSVVIKSLSKRVLIAVCYRPPNADSDFLHNLNSFIEFAIKSNLKDIILLGDFNFPTIQWINGSGFPVTLCETSFTDSLQDHGFLQLVTSPTRGSNILDLVLTTNEYLVENIETTDDEAVSLKSDHKSIMFDVLLNHKPKFAAKRKIYNYNKGDFVALRESLKLLPLTDIVLSENDIDIAWSKWKDTFLAVVDTYIPSRQTSRTYTPPYFTREIIHILHQKESLRKRARKSNSALLWEKFRELRRSAKRMIKTKKRDYIRNLANTIKFNPKQFWKFFKSKSNKSTLPDTMTLADSTFKSSSDKADALNKFFASVFLPRPQNPCFPPSNTVPVTPTEFSDVSVEEVCRLLNNLSTSKATGPDGISARLLKECSDVLAPSLTALFNKSITLGKVPADWKYANIVPVPKNNKTHIVSNYRPISLLSLVSKALEHVVHNRVLYIVKPLLHDQQHGFRSGKSCITQLLDVVYNIGKALDCGKEMDMIYLDFSKAFDSVPHDKLIFKLSQFGITGPLLDWFSDYLSGRKQRVVVDGLSSSYLDVTSGVPQGSIVGPLLFLIYVNDLPDAAKHSKVPMFADDSKCYKIINNPHDSNLLQSDLQALCLWSSTSKLKFNLEKCSGIRFSRKRCIESPDYFLCSSQIPFQSTQKDLGILITNNLKWSPHISNIVSKANRMLGFLRRNCTYLTDINCRRSLYLTLVRTHLCYGSEIWAPQTTSRDLLCLESVQRRATKYILQDFTSSYPDRLKKLNLLPISYWFEIKDITFFYKCKAGYYDLTLEDYILDNSTNHHTRFSSTDSYRPNRCRTSSFRNLFFNRIVPLWNSLPGEIKSSLSIQSLKLNLYNHYTQKVNACFDVNRPRTWKTFCTKCRTCFMSCCS